MIPRWRPLIDFFFPPRCPFCGETREGQDPYHSCPVCFAQIKKISHPRCPRCGLGFVSEEGEDHLCSDCLQEPGNFRKARAFAHYEGLIADLISRFKYRGASRLARPLGNFLADWEEADLSFGDYDLMMPVPLHPLRLRQRGYNQSLLLARNLNRKFKVPLDFTTLRRIRPTQPQTELSGTERQKNIRGAFSVLRPESTRGKTILLLDDVFTTGATVEECAKVLLKAGSRQVDVLTLARAR